MFHIFSPCSAEKWNALQKYKAGYFIKFTFSIFVNFCKFFTVARIYRDGLHFRSIRMLLAIPSPSMPQVTAAKNSLKTIAKYLYYFILFLK